VSLASHHVPFWSRVFTVRFLAIHPFQDGNGGWHASHNLFLLHTGYGTCLQFSRAGNRREPKQYYRALRKRREPRQR
jgi:Fic family protein